MPSMSRPDVDLLDGLTTAIIVDQERMGANARSTVGTATDANTLLRILFSRLGQPRIGTSQAFSFNIPTARGSGVITVERGGRRADRPAPADGSTVSHYGGEVTIEPVSGTMSRRTFTITGGMSRAVRGWAASRTSPRAAVRRAEVARGRRHHGAGLHPGRLDDQDVHGFWLPRSGQAHR